MVQRATFNSAAIRVFDTFGDLIEDVSYRNAGVWNPITETQEPAATETVRMKASPFTRREIDGANVMIGDLKALIIQTELTLTPKIDDFLTWDGVDYLVRAVENVHQVLWRLQLRRV